MASNFGSATSILHHMSCCFDSSLFKGVRPLKDVFDEFFRSANDLLVRLQSPNLLPAASKYLRPLAASDEWLSLHAYFQSINDRETNSAWRAWRIWSPDPKHLDLIERFPRKWRSNTSFQRVFKLEGPDFESARYQTQFHHQLAESSTSSVQSECLKLTAKVKPCKRLQLIASNIFDLLDGVLTLPVLNQGKALDLIDRVLKAEPVHDHHIRIADAVINFGFNPPEVAAVFQNFFTNTYTNRQKHKAATLQRVLEFTEMSYIHGVKEDVAILVGAVIAGELDQRLKELRRTVFIHPELMDAEFSDIQPYLQLLNDNRWLEKYIEITIWTTAQLIPSKEAMESIPTFREEFFFHVPLSSALRFQFGSYVESKLLGGSKHLLDADEIEFFDILVQKTIQVESAVYKSLIFKIALLMDIPVTGRTFIIKAVAEASSEFVAILEPMFTQHKHMTCVSLAGLLSKRRSEDNRDLLTWKRVLELLITPNATTILKGTATSLNFSSWIKWIFQIRKLYDSQNAVIQSTGLLSDKLHDWIRLLLSRSFYFSQLNAILGGTGPAMKALYLSYDHPVQMLCLLDLVAKDGTIGLGLCKVLLSRIPLKEEEFIDNVSHILTFVRNTNPDSQVPSIQRLLAICKAEDENVFQALLLAWWESRDNISRLADLLEARVAFNAILPYLKLSRKELQLCLSAAGQWLKARHDTLQPRMTRLRDMKLGLKLHDHHRTTKLLINFGIIETGLLPIPFHLAEVIEEVGATGYDIIFPLSELKPLRKLSLGVGSAKCLVVRIGFTMGSLGPKFHVRLDPEPQPYCEHKPVGTNFYVDPESFNNVDAFTMGGLARPCRITYVIMRLLLLHFTDGFECLEAVYKLVSDFLLSADRCIMCLASFGVTVWRPTTCKKRACVNLASWKQLQLSDFCPKVLDLYILSAINSNSEQERDSLLPGCPIVDSVALYTTTERLPRAASLQHSLIQYPGVWQGSDAMSLITYLTSLRVFVTEATGMLKIPSLPNIHQFVVCSSCPEVEAIRTRWLLTNPAEPENTQVVFHGTSVDRLISILTDGLKALSFTALQGNGANFGKGIYCSPELSFALSYSKAKSPWRNTVFEGAIKVVLGCELVGNGRVVTNDGKIIIVDDAAQLSVRYIFLFPPGAQAPEARFVVPAMKSAFGLIRARSV
jgi:hypothetical protein